MPLFFINQLLFKVVRYVVFPVFYLMSARLLLSTGLASPPGLALWLSLAGLSIMAFTFWRPFRSLYALTIGVPLLSGLQHFGFLQVMPIIEMVFSCIYLAWLPRHLWQKRSLELCSPVAYLTDGLALLVLLSLAIYYSNYPAAMVWYRAWNLPVLDRNCSLYGIEAAQTLLTGIFFFRLLSIEIHRESSAGGNPVQILFSSFYIQAAVIILFSFGQILFHLPEFNIRNLANIGVFSPFEDIHSYGSYVIVLFFIFLLPAVQSEGLSLRARIFYLVSAGIFFFLIIRAWSRTTLASAVLVAFIYFMIRLPRKKKVLLLLPMILLVTAVNVFPSIFMDSESHHVKRFAGMLYLKGLFLDAQLHLRFNMAGRAVAMVADAPLKGSGIGSFYRDSILYSNGAGSQFAKLKENTHNYYLQLAAELGLPALILFTGVIFCSLKAGFQYLADHPESQAAARMKGLVCALTAYLMTWLTGHPLLSSSHQVLFWLMVSLILFFRGNRTKMEAIRKREFPRVIAALCIVAGISGHLYSIGQAGPVAPFGIYEDDTEGGNGIRWTMGRTRSVVAASGNILSFEIYASPQHAGSCLELLIEGDLIDRRHLMNSGHRLLQYYVPGIEGREIIIETILDRTFKPFRLGMNTDMRDLGIGMGPFEFGDKMPDKMIGFHAIEREEGNPPPGWPSGQLMEFRWTGRRATFDLTRSEITRAKGEFELFLRCAHPDIASAPVTVIIENGRGEMVRKEVFRENDWKRVDIDVEKTKSEILTFKVSRTWNPGRLSGLQDTRDLGVAVAISGNPL